MARVRTARPVAHRRRPRLLAPALAAGLGAAVVVGPGWAVASPTVTGVVRAATDPATGPATDPAEPTPTGAPTTTDPTTAPPTASAPPETTTPTSPATPPASTTAPGGPAPTTAAPAVTAPAPPSVPPSVVSPPSSGPADVPPAVRVTTGSGIALRAGEVVFDLSGAPSALDVRLGNTGRVDAAGRVDVILPAGVSVTDPPAGCTATAPDRTRCDLGSVPAGQNATLRLPMAATAEAQRRAPLSGAVIGRLAPGSGRARQVQMTFRIGAAAVEATPPVAAPAPTGSPGVLAAAADDRDSPQRLVISLMVVFLLLVVLALVLATASLRRGTGAPVADPAGDAPAPVTHE
ncbi:hypothetical protein GA0074695_6364 [Micromonospora viridifaciens]|uniref:Uncharacterized protein n=1 Tax=Micromonospora viridifaciens TaxID=1881 RepID=A0A1C4ZZ52_MICVI|nr:hypothetical protein [Micromonospora viridifaciens]SCF38240.1 hypothetical protein GA0074695_6364 [Micromonospora viridifaciens]